MLKRIIPTLNRIHDYDALTIRKLKHVLEIIPTLDNYKKFNVFFHGGILDHPETTKDLDIKITRRQKPMFILEIENFIFNLETEIRKQCNIFTDIIFIKKIASYKAPWKPTHETIDKYDPPVLQALYALDKRAMTWDKDKIDIKYLYHRRPRKFKTQGNLQIYYSGEWAARGHKFNPSYQELSQNLKAKMQKDPWSMQGKVFNNIQRMKFHQKYQIPYLRNIEVREILKSHKKNPLTSMEDFSKRFKHQYTEEESTQ